MGVKRKARGFRGNEDGTATIEFVLLFPVLMFIFLMGFEAGYYMVRTIMLERAVEVSVRDVRLGGVVPNYNDLKTSICDEAAIIPDCMNSLMVELDSVQPVPGSVAQISSGPIRCIDRSGNNPQDGAYAVGQQNQAMLVRVCVLSEPLFPTTAIGVGMRADLDGNHAIVARASFVNEPGNRAINVSQSGNP